MNINITGKRGTPINNSDKDNIKNGIMGQFGNEFPGGVFPFDFDGESVGNKMVWDSENCEWKCVRDIKVMYCCDGEYFGVNFGYVFPPPSQKEIDDVISDLTKDCRCVGCEKTPITIPCGCECVVDEGMIGVIPCGEECPEPVKECLDCDGEVVGSVKCNQNCPEPKKNCCPDGQQVECEVDCLQRCIENGNDPGCCNCMGNMYDFYIHIYTVPYGSSNPIITPTSTERDYIKSLLDNYNGFIYQGRCNGQNGNYYCIDTILFGGVCLEDGYEIGFENLLKHLQEWLISRGFTGSEYRFQNLSCDLSKPGTGSNINSCNEYQNKKEENEQLTGLQNFGVGNLGGYLI